MRCYLSCSPGRPVSLPAHGHQRSAPPRQTVDPAQVPDGGGHRASELGQPQTSTQAVNLLALPVSHAEDVLGLVEDQAVHHLPVPRDVVEVLPSRAEHRHTAVAVPGGVVTL